VNRPYFAAEYRCEKEVTRPVPTLSGKEAPNYDWKGEENAMKKSVRVLTVLLAGIMLLSTSAWACTGMYVGKDVSDQGTYVIARCEDQGQSDYNKMFKVEPRVENVPGRYIEDTATGFKIPLPDTTYRYSYVPDYSRGDDGMYPGSCINEYGVSVTATVSTHTCDAWREADPFVEPGLREAIMSAAVAAVSTSARDAVDVLLGYVDTYGSEEANTVMISDQKEAWFVEIYSGHHYCAMKMPDDKVAVFGNQLMIGLVDPNATVEDGFIYSDGLFELIDKLELAVKEGDQYHLAKSLTGTERRDSSNMRNWAGLLALAPSLAGEYKTEEFYPLFYTPEIHDGKVSVLDLMDLYRDRYEGTPLDVTLEGQTGNRVIGTPNSSQIHILQTFPEWPAASAAINWLCLGNTEHSVFIPSFSGITDTADAYKVDGETYDPAGAYWKFKRICTLSALDRALYGDNVKKFWQLQEEIMYDEMAAAAPIMMAKYAESEEAGAQYVTELGIQMAEREMTYSDNLYAHLLTAVTHNTGRAADRVRAFMPDVPLRQVAENRGYTVTWTGTEIIVAKGETVFTFAPDDSPAFFFPQGYACTDANGQPVELSNYAYAVDGTTYVPMDFVELLK